MRLPLKISALLMSVVSGGCFSTGEGLEPPLNRVYFPTGLTLDADSQRLFVANSNFDLQFNGGSLQSWNLDEVRKRLPQYCASDDDCGGGRCDLASNFCASGDGSPCGVFGVQSPEQQLIAPGFCGYVDPKNPQDGGEPIIVSAVGIGTFATDLLFVPRPADAPAGPRGRVFVPVRGDTTLHWADVDDDGLIECGQSGNEGDCDDRHRRGDDPGEENTRRVRLPAEPFALAASEDSRAIALTHQTEGAASLFINDWTDAGPRLEFVAGSMPRRPIGIAHIPQSAHAKTLGTQPGFLVTFRDAAELRLIRFFDDAVSSPQRPFIQVTERVEIRANSVGFDSRGIAVDASARLRAEQTCREQGGLDEVVAACLETASAVPLRVFIANRTPASLLVGETRPGSDLPRINRAVPLPLGPSRVVLGEITNREGQRELRVFVLVFDSRRIYIWDPEREDVEQIISTGRGPHALVVDAEHGLGYIAHFTDSYISVVDLNQRHAELYGKIVLNIARPTAPRASK
jgi:hypothetical protein